MKEIYGKSCTKKLAEECLNEGAIVAVLFLQNGNFVNFITYGKLAFVKENKCCFLNGRTCWLNNYSNKLVKGSYYIAK